MLIVIRNPKYRLLALGVSLALLVIIYFAVINPSNDTANKSLTRAEQRLQQAAKSGPALPAGVHRLTACILAAGADVGKIHACQAAYHP